MEMVRVGGHFIQVNVANNYMGHGFWQFSPELIYRIFSPENGFQIKVVLLHELNMGVSGASFGAWYKVDDPAVHHSPAALINGRPTYICTIAQRVDDRQIFSRFPHQSNYVEAWKQTRAPRSASSTRRRKAIRRVIPGPVRNLARWSRRAIKNTMSGPFDRPCCQRVSSDEVMRGRV
jgi:hypothetical protein